MLNLLNMEASRLWRQRSSYLIIISMLVILMIYSFMLDYSFRDLQESMQMGGQQEQVQDEEEPQTDDMTLNFAVSPELLEASGEEVFLEQISGRGYLVFLIIFSALFFTAPYTHGYIKNFIGLQRRRSHFVLATFLAASIFCCLLFLFGSLIQVLMQNVWMSDTFKIIQWKHLLPLLGTQFLLHLATLAVSLFLATWLENTGPVMAINLLWSLIFYRPILDLIQTVLDQTLRLPEDFSLYSYSLAGSISLTSWGASGAIMRQSLIVALLYLVLALVASSWLLQKKDIR